MTKTPLFVSFYDPEFYDLKIGPGRRVAELYTTLAQEAGGPVLELGSGTGQVVLAIAAAGIAATGVEGAPRMLEHSLRNLEQSEPEIRRNASFSYGLIEDFKPACAYTQIFFSNDVIAHLHDDEELVQVLARYRKSLAPGGRLVLDVSPFDYFYMGQFAQPQNHVARLRGETAWRGDARMLCWETTLVDPTNGLLIARFRYDIIAADGSINQSIERQLHLYPRREQEIRVILHAAGFSLVRQRRATDPAGDFLLFIADV